MAQSQGKVSFGQSSNTAAIPPDQPVAPTFGTVTSGSIVINWTAPNSNGVAITSYSLEQKTGSGGTFAEIFNGNALTFTSTNLAGGTQYFYRVKATRSEEHTSELQSH